MRPERGDILDNFTPDMAQFVADLLKTMPGARLVVRRSRRRPWAEWGPVPDAAHIGRVSYEMLSAMTYANAQRNGWPIADPSFDPFRWQSPAQRGRKNGRRRKGERISHMSMMTPMGPMSIIADRFCRDDEFHFIGQGGAHVVNIQPPVSHAAVAEALEASGETRATSVIVSPRNWATLDRNAAAMRAFDASYRFP